MEIAQEDLPVEPRAKRQKKDKNGRFAALQKLKDLQGKRSMHKYEVDQVENVYDVVDEKEYCKRVQNRQEEDWIVDDAGIGYVEDGREIFDDDMDSESIANESTKKGRGSKRKKKQISENAGRGNLQQMLSSMPAKKKEEKIEDDDILSELISEIDNGEASTSAAVTPVRTGVKVKRQSFSLIEEKRAVNNYMKSLASTHQRSTPSKLTKEQPQKELHGPDVEENNIQMNGTSIIHENDEGKAENNQGNKNTETGKPKTNLLFTVGIETNVDKEQNETVEFDMDMPFGDDDFDFTSIDLPAETANQSMKVLDITEEQLIEGFTFSDEGVINDSINDEFDKTLMSGINSEDKNDFRFFWWDAYEDERNQPGVVVLFGKTYSEESKTFVSCSVVIKNIQRKIYLLPRPYFLDDHGKETDVPVSIMDVYQEFNEQVAKAYNMTTYKSKKVVKKYVFDSSIPEESEYLEVRYDGKYEFNEKNYKTFSRILGMNSSFMEIFLLERKLKGPCWLNIANYEVAANPYTHASLEIRCSKASNVTVLESPQPIPPPPLVVVTLNIVEGVNPKNNSNEIVMICCLVNNRYYLNKKAPNPAFNHHFCVLTKLSNTTFPPNMHVALSKYKTTKVQKMDTEKAMLNYFVTQFAKIDPDLIVGHDLNGYQLSILASRLQASNTTNYSRLSRIKRSNGKSLFDRFIFTGRLVCDIKDSAKELIRARAYDLNTLCQKVLKVPEGQRIEIEAENVALMYSSCVDLFKFVSLTMQDSAYILRILFELNVIPLALQITNLAGNIMSRTLVGGRSERNEYLLLHAFYDKDYIVPEKVRRQKAKDISSTKRKKPTYVGGLVLEPKVGFYDKFVLLMDFNSLYPSIIQEYNICFTTMNGAGDLNDEEAQEALEMALDDQPTGILPTEIRKLVESRRQVKKLMAQADLSPDVQLQYNIRQTALKLTANSMYGCLGFANSRFYSKRLAAFVTQRGREILTSTRDIVEGLSYEVVYGDTDSIMINTRITDFEQVFKIGNNIKKFINRMYKQVELDIDGVFKYLLLVKKKKYAAVVISKDRNGRMREVQEHKGLDIVRRDWSQLAAQAGTFILNQLLCDQSNDDRIDNILKHMSQLKEDLEEGKVPLSLLVITKQLTKNPTQYTDANAQAHVTVALRHNQTKGKKFRAGDTVPYVICKDGSTKSAMQRAYLLDELKSNAELSIDCEYYLSQQIFPVVSRLCEPIDVIETHQIGCCLGVERRIANKLSSSSKNAPNDIKRINIILRNCQPFTFNCLGCKFDNVVNCDNNDYALEICGNPECNVQPFEFASFIKNKLLFDIRKFMKRFYAGELSCEDPMCTGLSHRIPQRMSRKYPICVTCKQSLMYTTYPPDEFYAQLIFYQRIFDLANRPKREMDSRIEDAYNMLKAVVDKFLQINAYAVVNLTELFGGIWDSDKEELRFDQGKIFGDEEEDEEYDNDYAP